MLATRLSAYDPTADAFFGSCIVLRAAACVTLLEARLGTPVVTSNQPLVWRCMHHPDITTEVPNGSLLF
ncbi:MAG: hypothetical protein ABJI96_05090 [Paracoccaceae bacterium]